MLEACSHISCAAPHVLPVISIAVLAVRQLTGASDISEIKKDHRRKLFLRAAFKAPEDSALLNCGLLIFVVCDGTVTLTEQVR